MGLASSWSDITGPLSDTMLCPSDVGCWTDIGKGSQNSLALIWKCNAKRAAAFFGLYRSALRNANRNFSSRTYHGERNAALSYHSFCLRSFSISWSICSKSAFKFSGRSSGGSWKGSTPLDAVVFGLKAPWMGAVDGEADVGADVGADSAIIVALSVTTWDGDEPFVVTETASSEDDTITSGCKSCATSCCSDSDNRCSSPAR
mmetsp:Transcript_18032/g.51240  ORF Transcript_18032/g.51240 Transcript_18032/m.51240 type:complete len:203 (-) Transcript_18032:1332-1940(-)